MTEKSFNQTTSSIVEVLTGLRETSPRKFHSPARRIPDIETDARDVTASTQNRLAAGSSATAIAPRGTLLFAGPDCIVIAFEYV